MAKPPARYAGHLIVHTGDHKTGTTSIQEALTRGDVRLADGGQIAYPVGKGQFNHNFMLKPVRTHRFALPRSMPLDEPFARFAARSLREATEVTVLSAERLESTPPEALAAALARHLPAEKLTVVTYVRPHIPRMMSNLAEHLKIGWASADPWRGAGFRAWQRLRYMRRVPRWAAAFGPAYVLRPAIRAELAGGDALEDLMTTAIGPGRTFIRRGKASNESLGVEDLMRIQLVHRAIGKRIDRWQHHDLGWMLAERIDTLRPAGGPSTPLRAHKALAERMRRLFRADARALDAAYFAERPLFAAALDAAVDTALPDRMPLTPEAWLDPGDIAALRERAEDYAAQLARPGWKADWKEERLARILARGAES